MAPRTASLASARPQVTLGVEDRFSRAANGRVRPTVDAVAFAHGLEGGVVERLAFEFADRAAGFEQELAHAPGSCVALGVLDELEVSL